MNETEQLFLDILRDYLHKEKSELPEQVDWKELLDIARKHEATGILYYQLKRKLDSSNIEVNQKVKLFRTYADLCLKYEKRIKLLDEIDRIFNENRIPYFIFKGIDIAELYPNPKLRTMGDSDILIHEEDEMKAHECLLKIGCEIDETGVHEWHYHREDIHLELHRKMMNLEAPNTKEQIAFFDRRWDYAIPEENSMHCHLDWNFHFVYVITHLRKHFIVSGVGFRQFMDIAVIAENCSLNWDWIEKELTAMNMWGFAKSCFAFCSRWFGTEFPVKTEEIPEAFYQNASKRIFAGGVFGTDDARNLQNAIIYKAEINSSEIDIERNSFSRAVRQLGKGSGEKKAAVFRNTVYMLFPSYTSMKKKADYTFITGRPYLLPAAWIYRIYRYLTGQVDKDFAKAANELTDEQIDERTAFLKSWNIL